MESTGSDDSLTSFSLLQLPQTTATTMDSGWTASAIESWIEDTMQHVSGTASEARISSTQDAAIAAICDHYMRISLASSFEGVEDQRQLDDDDRASGVSMSNCRRCSLGKHDLEVVATSISDGNSSSTPGSYSRGPDSKVTHTSPGSGSGSGSIRVASEVKMRDVVAKAQSVVDLNSSHLRVRLATHALSQLVESGVS